MQLYVEGYLQAMLDVMYKLEYLRVRVIDNQVSGLKIRVIIILSYFRVKINSSVLLLLLTLSSLSCACFILGS